MDSEEIQIKTANQDEVNQWLFQFQKAVALIISDRVQKYKNPDESQYNIKNKEQYTTSSSAKYSTNSSITINRRDTTPRYHINYIIIRNKLIIFILVISFLFL